MALFELSASQHVDGLVVGNAEQPRQESATAGLIRVGLAPQFEKRFLHHFFGRGWITQQAKGQRIHAATVAVVDALESGRFTLGDAFDEQAILVTSRVEAIAGGRFWPTTSKGEPEFHGQASIPPRRVVEIVRACPVTPRATSLFLLKVRMSRGFRFKLAGCRSQALRACERSEGSVT